ncbi:DUF2993 domain-containing protein [Microbacterium enclense]|uniref:LmeA family phospholipid-binding protein n=1 Tax=Microbacterium enclense TaxID=993073 RepID=UPI0021A739A4|nr:DUF2993 domain-containing protein [Microbacterium enclense]MCT2086383.1 DUF2993 domain-containing protein [Microbacterium enclense]
MTDATHPRRRTGRMIAIVVIVLVVIAGVLVAAEVIARSAVANTVRSLVVQQVGLPADQQVDVAVPGIVLPQLVKGRLDQVAVSAPDVVLGPLNGDVRVDLQDVPVAGDAPAAGGSASVRLAPDQLRALLAQIPDFPADTVDTAAPDVTLSTEFSVFGISIPVGISATPGAADGDLTLTPTAFDLGGNRVDADTLRGQLGGVTDRAVQTWRLCIADRLPAGLTLDGVSVQGEDVVATFAIDGRLLNDPALQQNGTCG